MKARIVKGTYSVREYGMAGSWLKGSKIFSAVRVKSAPPMYLRQFNVEYIFVIS